MKELRSDPRREAILMSALQAFASYGFRKTSMDDIASGAGMSRPAVYLHYKNKAAIVRSLTERHYEEKLVAIREALAGSGSVSETLTRAIKAHCEGMATILASPHGLELLDAGKSNAPDIVTKGEAELAAIYAEWLKQEADAGRARLADTPNEVAKTITAALKGIKLTSADAEEFERRLSQLASLFGAGLEVR